MICTSTTSYRRRKWIAPTLDESAVADLACQLRLPPLIARLLLNRGHTSADSAAAFLDPKFKDLPSPWLLPNIDHAATRITHAIREKQKITLYGDYDVDGITGTTMLFHTLTAAGNIPDSYIPHRVDEGYGLNPEAIQSILQKNGPAENQLLITIDCGISALEPITLARQHHLDVIISDHHEFGPDLPPANFIVHPRLHEAPANSEFRIQNSEFAPYPNPDLCGAGVAFKLAWAVAQKLCNAERVNDVYRNLLLEFSALAALGTIADVVPLTGENRILVKYGLQQLARTTNPGLIALIHAAGYSDPDNGRPLDTTAVGFSLAPRLNAAGRMGHAREAVELLTTATGPRATEIATYLESQNKSRQSTEKKMLETAQAQLKGPTDHDPRTTDHVLVVSHPSFHAGVVGIVASRLVDLYHRPTFVLATTDDHAHGSARSIPGFELHAAIEACRDLLLTGGGHAMAGGVKLPLANLDAFRARLNEFAAIHLTDDLLIPSIHLDGILSLEDAKPATIALLDRLAPFGRGNAHPRFLVESVRISAPPRRVGATGAHLQLTVSRPGTGRAALTSRCIAFKMGDLEPQLPVGTELHLVVEPKIDHYTGTPRVDLQILDLTRADQFPFNI